MKDKALDLLKDIQNVLLKNASDVCHRENYRTEFHVWLMSDDSFQALVDKVDDAIAEVKEIEEAEES